MRIASTNDSSDTKTDDTSSPPSVVEPVDEKTRRAGSVRRTSITPQWDQLSRSMVEEFPLF